MSDKYYWFTVGFMTAIMISMFVISCTSPLEANVGSCGQDSWNPCYVRIVE